MTLKTQLTDDMKTAMKAGDKPRLGVIRLINAAIKQKEVDERIEVDDAAVFGVEGDLAVDRMRAQAIGAGPGGVVHRHAGLVAGGLDAEDDQAVARSEGEPLSYAARPL